MTSLIPAAVRRSLRETFGFDELRAGQHEVISRVLRGEDTLAIMPTGAGKSLCYQLPALHLEGTTLVVSPLISLMKDQAEKLEEAGVNAEQLNSAQKASEQDASMTRIAQERSDIVFATPERLADPEFRAAMAAQRISLLVIDEAHCISQWGHDFRPAYLELAAAREALGRPTLLALTATATSDVVDDIRRQLKLPDLHVVNTGMYRANLVLQVAQVTNADAKADRLLETLRNAQGTGIVYASTVKVCTEVFERLQAAGESVTIYHGRLPAAQRNANQDDFMTGAKRVMVATNAFGMGIDKPDIRFVVHYQLPGSAQAYYQEAGRAGRDAERADCVLIFDRKDRQVQQFFLARRYPDAQDLRSVLDVLDVSPDGMALTALPPRIPGMPRNRIAVALNVLRDGQLATCDAAHGWRRSRRPADAAMLDALAAEYAHKSERDHEALERMVFYAQTGFCRWRVLLECFGEPLPFASACGRCDNCLRAPIEPAIDLPDPLRRTAKRPARPMFAAGDVVKVPRYGDGQVAASAGDEVTVTFADGSERTFMAAYVKSTRAPRRPRIPAGSQANPLPRPACPSAT